MTQELVENTQAEAAVLQTQKMLTTTTTTQLAGKDSETTTTTTTTAHTEINVTSSVTVITEEDLDKPSKLYKQCLLFPSYAYWSSRVEDGENDAGEWTIRINGWIFGFPKKSNRRRLALGKCGIARLLSGLSSTDEHYAHFERRTRMFFAVDTPDVPVRVQAIGVTTPEKFELDGDPADHIYSEGCGPDCSDSDSSSGSSKKKTDLAFTRKKLPPLPVPENAPSMELLAESGYLRGHLPFFTGEPERPTSGVVNLISPHGIS
ncbi:hypothetical protein BDF22DRAFT_745556 [Syncephalis plumigaleata]|nr:hypothetical protein BDF22DRAFT_745556 [Syncephalis plumigaleata]